MGPFEPLIGAFFVGTAFNLVMFGTTYMQTVYYYRTYANDKAHYQWAVLLLFILGLFHTIASCVTMYDMVVLNFDNVPSLNHIPWGFIADPISTGVIALIVEIFYAYRVYVVSGRKAILIPAGILVLAALQLTTSFYSSVWASFHPYFSDIPQIRWAVGLWLFSMAAGDVVITAGLYFYLAKQKGGRENTDSVLGRVIKNTVSNNLATGVASVASSLLYIAGPGAWHVIFGLIISKLYQMSLLASLNVRVELAKDLSGGTRSGVAVISAANGQPGNGLNGGATAVMASKTKSVTQRLNLSRNKQEGSFTSSGSDSMTGSSSRHGGRSDHGVGTGSGFGISSVGNLIGKVGGGGGGGGGAVGGVVNNSGRVSPGQPASLPIQVTVEETKTDFMLEPVASWDHSTSRLNFHHNNNNNNPIVPVASSPRQLGIQSQEMSEKVVADQIEHGSPHLYSTLDQDLEKGDV